MVPNSFSLFSLMVKLFVVVSFYLLLIFGKEKGYRYVEFTRQRAEIFFYGFIFAPSLSF